MVEVEAKIILPSCEELPRLEEKLRALKAVLEDEVVEEDTYYQHPCRDFAETDEALRLRATRSRSSMRYEVTYKGPKRVIAGSKAREEYTVRVDEPGEAARLLEALGFRPVAVVKKKRRYYRLGDIVFSLDDVEGLGCFLEAEYRGEGGVNEASNEINKALETIGAAGYPRTAKSYLELLLEKQGKG
ncbi:class IV adenylate cyclase [Pyrofollis japonicus]|uniref:class IV adenylate cyclase n=1 Tax=Pyrofollis japonicus TaxID=3060460 RepID=UPI00295C10BB|nr:class IV adenylate cyclase [Pyrofollis japonicus]BEP16813.1 class IV adenylate cyclase [Pyrofollis japonicus]